MTCKKYFPFVFSLFSFIVMCNLLGMLPYSYTVTSHIAVTIMLALSVFVLTNGSKIRCSSCWSSSGSGSNI